MNLQDAIDLHDLIVRHVPDDKEWADHVKPIVDAARRVANPDLNALIDHLDYLTGVQLNVGQANELWGAALGITEDTNEG